MLRLIDFIISESQTGWTVICEIPDWESQFKATIEVAIVLAKSQSDILGPARITIQTLNNTLSIMTRTASRPK